MTDPLDIVESLQNGERLYSWFQENHNNPEAIISWSRYVVSNFLREDMFDVDIMYGIAHAYAIAEAKAVFRERQRADMWSRKERDEFDDEVKLHSKRITSANDNEQGDIRKPIIIRAENIQAKPIDWLWEPYLARGMLAMLDGDPGVGKSLLTIQIAAAISRGWCLPDQQGKTTLSVEPANVLFLIAEESHDYTFRPRLDWAGADPSRIRILTGFTGKEDEEIAFTFQRMEVLRAACREVKPSLVIIDPIQAYLGEININQANETRPLLTALRKVAEESHAAVVCLRHLAKGSEGSKAIYRGMASIDFIGAARTALMVQQHPADRDKAIILQSKSNIGMLGRSQIFTRREGQFGWCGVTRLDGESIAGSSGPNPAELIKAAFWLEENLSYMPQPSQDIIDRMLEEGFKMGTINRAKKAIGVVTKKNSTMGWFWSLPSLSITANSSNTSSSSTTSNTSNSSYNSMKSGRIEEFEEREEFEEVEVPNARARDTNSVPENDDLDWLTRIEDENAREREEGRG